MKSARCLITTLSAALSAALIGFTGHAAAASPSELMASYATAASPGFTPSAERGRALYSKKFSVSDTMPACTACHTDNPRQAGKHVVTGKAVQPMAPGANPERFTDSKKAEKWFRRNCSEVVGRECTPGEKADFIAYLSKE